MLFLFKARSRLVELEGAYLVNIGLGVYWRALIFRV